MQEDYRIIKETLLKQLHMDYPPIYVFGLEALKQILEKEEERTFESEAVAAAAATEGLSVIRLKPSYARVHQFPFYVPASADLTANGYAVSASKVLKKGLKSLLLRNFEDRMSEDGATAPPTL